MDKIQKNEQQLFTDIRQLIDDARLMASRIVSSGVTALYWNIGTRINKEILNNQRAEYGQQIVATLARQLVKEYGNNFEEKNLRRIIQFAQIFSDTGIASIMQQPVSQLKTNSNTKLPVSQLSNTSIFSLGELKTMPLLLGHKAASYSPIHNLLPRNVGQQYRRQQ